MTPSVAYLLSDSARLLRRAFDMRMRAMGVTGPQARLLLVLGLHEGENQGFYAEQLDVEAITLGRMLDRMEEAGLIERRRDPADRRAWRVHLTPAGLDLLPELREGIERTRHLVERLLQLARDEAIVRNQPIAFEADDYRYRFLIRQNNDWRALTDDSLLREREYRRAPLSLLLQPSGSERLPLRIVFGREPVDKAFLLTMGYGGQSATIRADGIGNFQVE